MLARFQTAAAARSLLQELKGTKEPGEIVDTLNGFDPPTSEQAVARPIATAAKLATALAAANWDLIQIDGGPVSTAHDALTKDELTDPLEARLGAAEAEATRIATASPTASPSQGAKSDTSPAKSTSTSSSAIKGQASPANRIARTITSADELDALVDEVRAAVDSGSTVHVEWTTDT